MDQAVRLLSENWSTIGTLVFSAVVAWSAIASNRLNKRLVEAELDPAITAYLEPHPTAFRMFELVVRNVGRGSAREVRFEIEATQRTGSSKAFDSLSQLGIVQTGMPFFPAGQELRFLVGTYQELETAHANIRITYYRDVSARKHVALRVVFPLNVNHYSGMHKVGNDPAKISAEALRAISAALNRASDADSFRVSMERKYIWSTTLNRWRTYWFGEYPFNAQDGPFRYFVSRIKTAIRL